MRRVNSQSKCNSKCCCCGCLDNLRICLLADGSTCPCRPLRGGLPSLPLANPAFSLLCRPHPPARARRALFPSGEGGDFLFSYARDFAPCIPGAEPARHWEMGANHAPGGGACLVCCLPTVPLACFPAPIPPPALAERSSPAGRGRFFVFLCKGLRPLHPRGLGGTRHWFCLWKTGFFGVE